MEQEKKKLGIRTIDELRRVVVPKELEPAGWRPGSEVTIYQQDKNIIILELTEPQQVTA